MPLDVAFLPRDVTDPERAVCIVIDALRATSTIATVFAGGAREVIVAGTIEEARRLRDTAPDALLCGESGGIPPEGFDHGNSPVEFAGLDLHDRTLILATSNGTRALSGLRTARAVFTGSLLNLSACTELATAETEGSLTVVCSGSDLGSRFSLEDTLVAGAFVERIIATDLGSQPNLTDSAHVALTIWRGYRDDPRAGFLDAVHGRALVELGLGDDLDFCATIDRCAVAPRLSLRGGMLVLN